VLLIGFLSFNKYVFTVTSTAFCFSGNALDCLYHCCNHYVKNDNSDDNVDDFEVRLD